MNDPHPFFRFVWRANALIILAAAGLLVLSTAYVAGGALLGSRSVSRSPGMETPLPGSSRDPAGQPQEVLHVGMFARAAGPVFHAPVYGGRPGDGYKSYASVKSGGRVHNVMIFNAETGAVTRLFPDDKGRIIDEEVVSRSRSDWPKTRTFARVFVYVPADANGDGRLDADDPQRIVVTRPDGSDQQVLAEGVGRYVTASPAEHGETMLSYFVRRGGELTFGEFDLDTFRPSRSAPVTVPRT